MADFRFFGCGLVVSLLLIGCASALSGEIEPLPTPLTEYRSQSCDSLNREIEILDQRIESLAAIQTANAVADLASIAVPPLLVITSSVSILYAGELTHASNAMAAAAQARESKGCVGPPPLEN